METVPPASPDPQSKATAEQVPRGIRLGTSSWSFPGWRGLVYAASAPAAALASEGLAAYAHHGVHRTVGLDRTFYEVPSLKTLRELAAQVPSDFRFLVKAHQAITRPHLQEDGSTRGSTIVSRDRGAPNPRFLDASWASDVVIGPLIEGLAGTCGPIVFQFPSLAPGPRGPFADEVAALDRVAGFLQSLPSGPCYAVEFRDASFLKGRAVSRLVEVLRAARAVPAIGVIPSMPSCAGAMAALRDAGWEWSVERPLVLRWLLGHGLGYEEARARFEPFHEAVAPDPTTRGQVADVVVEALRAGAEACVIVNNKAEGSAPRSVSMLGQAILQRLHRSVPEPRMGSLP